MGNISMFAQPSGVSFTVMSLIVLFAASVYAAKGTKLGKGIWLLYWGLVIEFITIYIGKHSSDVFNQGGAVEGWIFVELLLNLISMLLLAMAASQILVNSISDMAFIVGFGAVGLVAIIFFLFISPDGNMVSNMRQIFPLTGFAYISVSFLSQLRNKHNGGFIFAGMVSLSVAFIMALKLFGLTYLVSEAWYISAIVYILLSGALVMMKGDFFAKKLDESQLEIEKYNKRIEEIIKSSPFPIIISRLSDDRIIISQYNTVIT